MIQISKSEAKLVRKLFPGVPIKRTVHKFYTEERPSILKALGRVRQAGPVRLCS